MHNFYMAVFSLFLLMAYFSKYYSFIEFNIIEHFFEDISSQILHNELIFVQLYFN